MLTEHQARQLLLNSVVKVREVLVTCSVGWIGFQPSAVPHSLELDQAGPQAGLDQAGPNQVPLTCPLAAVAQGFL